MMFRRVDRLSSGMRVRIRVREHKREVVRQVDSVQQAQDRMRLSVRFFKEPSDAMAYGFNFYPDDLMEIADL